MKYRLLIITLVVNVSLGWSQSVTTDPLFPTASEPLTMTVDVSGTSLEGYMGDVYVWLWAANEDNSYLGPDAPTNVNPATSAQSAALVTRSSGDPNVYTFTFTPDDFIGVAASEIPKVGFKLKSVDWSDNIQSDVDLFIDMTEGGFNVNFRTPANRSIFVDTNEIISFDAISSAPATFTLLVDGMQENQQTGITEYNYDFQVTDVSGSKEMVLTVTDGNETFSNSYTYTVRSATVEEARPGNIIDGINYDASNTSKVTLSILAPNISSAYVVGDFNNWSVDASYQMKLDGEHFWLEIDGLTPGVEYAFQYLLDETIYVADPFADKILDPNDRFISSNIYPDLKPFPEEALKTEWYFNRLAVLQTDQQPYQWQVTDFQAPAKEDLVIYELLIRDFFEDGETSYDNLIDTLSYLESLGVNAIQLMPIMEFNGNDSWGYNPTFKFAVDKAYGTRDKFKEFIDRAHQLGMAVILDIVMNHHDAPNPYVLMDFNFTSFIPNETNRWFNTEAKHPFNVFFDMDHESVYTQNYLDTVNYYWLNEYKVDGFRYDLSKGFTQNFSGDVGQWNLRDESRIDLLKRMADDIWSYDPDAYIILEHFADNDEEVELANYGMMLWGNMHGAYTDITQNESAVTTGVYHGSRGWDEPGLVAYMESHDEERLMFSLLNEASPVLELGPALERIKSASALFYTIPGAKMLWQFGELGYDLSINRCPDGTINGDCRVAQKPIPWNGVEGFDYNNDFLRAKLFTYTSELIKLKTTYSVFGTSDVELVDDGLLKTVVLTNEPFTAEPNDASEMNAVVIGNFDRSVRDISVSFPHTGSWYHYFANGAVFESSASEETITLQPGEVRIYTDVALDSVDNELSQHLPLNEPVLESLEQVQNGIQLTWQDNSAIETRYRVLRSTDGVTFSSVEVLPADRTSYVDDDNITAETEYTYKVVAQNAVFESESDTLKIVPSNLVTSLDDEIQSSVKVFPNPAHDKISISATFTDFEVSPVVFDLLGNRYVLPVRKESPNQVSISTTTLATGVYFLQYEYQGNSIRTRFAIIR